jgi:8-oxo-dGTP diphosphatase
VGEEVAHVEFDYPAMRLNLTCYHCHLDSEVSAREHQSIRWLGPDELETVPWLPADLEILAEVRTLLVQPHAPVPTPGLFAAGNGSGARG